MILFKKKLSGTLKASLLEPLDKEQEIILRFIKRSQLIAKQHATGSGVLSLQIIQTQGIIQAALLQGKTLIKQIPLGEIVHFFADRTTAMLISKDHIRLKLEDYFNTFQKDIETESIGIRLLILKTESIKIYTIGTQSIQEVQLKEFIDFFKS